MDPKAGLMWTYGQSTTAICGEENPARRCAYLICLASSPRLRSATFEKKKKSLSDSCEQRIRHFPRFILSRMAAERLAGQVGGFHLLKGRALDVWHTFQEKVSAEDGGLKNIQQRANEKISVLKERAIDSLNRGNDGDYSHVYR